MLPIKKRILSILIILIPVISFSQESSIKDIKLEIKKNHDIIVNYNIKDTQNSTHHVDFLLIDDSKSVYFPEYQTGSIGSNIKSGENSVSFNMLNQDFPLDKELTPVLVLDHNYGNGPKVSFLSVLVPGLGDYYVAKPKNMVIKPYYKTIAVGSFIALAFIADHNKPAPTYYDKEVIEYTYSWVLVPNVGWEYQRNPILTTQTYKEPTKNNYWLFRNDKEIFLGIAAGIWVFDIFWVLNKGQQNNKIKKAISNRNYRFDVSSTGFSCKINLAKS